MCCLSPRSGASWGDPVAVLNMSQIAPSPRPAPLPPRHPALSRAAVPRTPPVSIPTPFPGRFVLPRLKASCYLSKLAQFWFQASKLGLLFLWLLSIAKVAGMLSGGEQSCSRGGGVEEPGVAVECLHSGSTQTKPWSCGTAPFCRHF